MAGLRRAFRLKTASRILAWSCILAVAFLSLIPAEQMLRTGFNGRAEHVLAYAATGFVTGLAFAERGLLRIILALLAYAGGLEYLLIAAVFYLVGTALFVWARRESRLPTFTAPEWVVVAVVALASVAAVVMMATGNLAVL